LILGDFFAAFAGKKLDIRLDAFAFSFVTVALIARSGSGPSQN